MSTRTWSAGLAAVILAVSAGGARAQVVGSDTFHGLADLRVAAGDAERSWLDRGFGKTIVSDDLEGRLAEASLEWTPRLNFSVSGVVTAHYQPDLDPGLDIGEAYLKLQAPPSALGRLTARIGVMYPEISHEHDGVAWTTPDMLTASALNSWIGEEVKVLGVEVTAGRAFGSHELEATAAVFGWNDTSGTLLTFRGWAMHGVRTGIKTSFDLPPLSAFMRPRQARISDPFYELDNRAGYYGRLEWRPPAPVTFDALYYDNAGDRTSVEAQQWSWETRFLNLGMRWDVDERTKVMAQAMNGETLMGFRSAGSRWVDMGFHAAYLLAARSYGEHTATARVDWFEANDRTLLVQDNNDETGWALTGAWRHRVAPHADVILEALHIDSERPSRALAGDRARQRETVVQTALRLSF